jgi:hypothetical protein
LVDEINGPEILHERERERERERGRESERERERERERDAPHDRKSTATPQEIQTTEKARTKTHAFHATTTNSHMRIKDTRISHHKKRFKAMKTARTRRSRALNGSGTSGKPCCSADRAPVCVMVHACGCVCSGGEHVCARILVWHVFVKSVRVRVFAWVRVCVRACTHVLRCGVSSGVWVCACVYVCGWVGG